MEYRHLKPYERPDSYIGPTWYGYFAVAGRHRDSDDLALSNFDQILAEMGGESGESEDRDEDERNAGIDSRDNLYISDVIIVCDSHWAVGWIETLYVHSRRADLLAKADALHARLEDYPVLDEDDYSRREWDTVSEYWANMSVRERIRILAKYDGSIFAARRDSLPEDPNGAIFDYLRTP